MNNFHTKMKIRIDWSEIDFLGHINNLAIMKYIQTARIDFLERVGMLPLSSETGLGPVPASTSCQFKKQLFYPGTVQVCSRVDQMKNTSFQMRHVVQDDTGDAVAEGLDVIVIFNFNKNTKQAIPGIYRERIKELEHGIVD